jgi:hypothetical protein
LLRGKRNRQTIIATTICCESWLGRDSNMCLSKPAKPQRGLMLSCLYCMGAHKYSCSLPGKPHSLPWNYESQNVIGKKSCVGGIASVDGIAFSGFDKSTRMICRRTPIGLVTAEVMEENVEPSFVIVFLDVTGQIRSGNIMKIAKLGGCDYRLYQY